MKQFFELEVFDFQKRAKDRPLGETSFKVSEVIEELPNDGGYAALSVNRWAPLKLKEDFNGELHYEISFFPSLIIAQEATEQENAALPPGTIRASDALDYDSGILAVRLVGANLDRSGTYCEVYVDSDFYQYKSRLQKSRDPKWNEMFDLFVKKLDYTKLVIQVMDKSGVDGSSIVGTVTASIRTLADGNIAEGVSLPILDKSDQRGTIQLKLGSWSLCQLISS